MKILDHDIYVDYGINFANETIFQPPFEQWDIPGEKRIRFLKPHGSFNWMYCPTCNSMYITGVKESRIFSTGYLHNVEHCPEDETELSYVMHPPSLYVKTYRNIYLQLVWKYTYDLLAEADCVYFIGYALKNADVWMKYMLKKSQVQKSKEFIVVNPQPEHQLRHKFARLLGEVKYIHSDFSGFVDHINEYIK
jgi:NAD-dependent SIR2 family protein deacetylase